MLRDNLRTEALDRHSRDSRYGLLRHKQPVDSTDHEDERDELRQRPKREVGKQLAVVFGQFFKGGVLRHKVNGAD